MMIISKIRLLLTYWTLHDLGISKADFGHDECNSHRVYLERQSIGKNLARPTGTAAFFRHAEMFDRLAHAKICVRRLLHRRASRTSNSRRVHGTLESWHTIPAGEYGLFSGKPSSRFESEDQHHAVYVESGGQNLGG